MIPLVESNTCSLVDVCAVAILGKLQGLCEMGANLRTLIMTPYSSLQEVP